ncbi:MAG: hypothetical protein H7289_02115 [Mucilaginibacter sp.]|nr:hypothetical protein [Mucilaginibacter sp.]
MKRILLILALVAGATLNTLAQKPGGDKFDIGLEFGKTTGSYSNFVDFAFGASLKYNHPIADGLVFTGSAGYTYLPYNNDFKTATLGFNVASSGEGFVPLKAGVKYFFNKTIYGEGQIGAALSTNSGGGAAFAYAPGIGAAFGGGADIGIRYEGWSKSGNTISQVALRIAYSF